MQKANEFLANGLHRLANLSSGNRMVYLPSLPERRGIDLTAFDHLLGKESAQLLVNILQRRTVTLCPVSDPRVPSSNDLSQRLRRICRTVDGIMEETGRMDLQVGWPVAEGTLNNGSPVRCPLLLIPVELSCIKDKWMIIARKDVPIMFNRSLLQAYAHFHEVPLLSEELEEELDEFGWGEDGKFDFTSFITRLYSLLESSALRLNFNRDNFSGRLSPLEFISRDEHQALNEPGKLRLTPAALLGIFPQSDSFLEPDFQEMIKMAEQGRPGLSSAEAFFESLAPDPGQVRFTGESSINTVFSADPWQEDVLRAAAKGQSLVVEGPPGTGKSQLICNLVAGAMAAGKNVLVVCQKRVALDVVAARLKGTGLDTFAALVHDVRDDRSAVYQKIAGHIQSVGNYSAELRQADNIIAGRTYLQACNRIESASERLEALRMALADPSPAGVPIRDLYLSSDRHAKMISIRPYLADFPVDALEHFCSHIRAVCSLREVLRSDEGFPLWENRRSMAAAGQEDLKEMKNILLSFKSEIIRFGKSVYDSTGLQPDYFQLSILAEHQDNILSIAGHFTPEQMPYLRMMTDAAANLSQQDPGDLWLANMQRLVDGCFDDAGVEESLATDQLGPAQQALYKAMSARRNLFRWAGWEMFAKDRFLIKRTLVANRLSGREGLRVLEQRLDNRLNLEHHLSRLRAFEWSVPLPDKISRETYGEWFSLTRAAFKTRRMIADIRGLEAYLAAESVDYREVTDRLRIISRVAAECKGKFSAWLRWFTPAQLETLGADEVIIARMLHFLERHFDRLCGLDRRIESMQPHELDILGRLEEAYPSGTADDLVHLFINSVQIAWIDHLEIRTPELRMVSSGELETIQQELRTDMSVKCRLAAQMARTKVLERICHELEYNRLNNRVTYRDLLHQTTKRRRVWPLRKTMAAFSDEIFRLLPCWLVSPESVSALFSLERYFDLVIFDEASQCFAERGLPAMFRARQVIVAGDAMQLQPSDFYNVRWEDDGEDPDLEAESLLSLARRHFPTFSLRGHYRSRSPELMEFSNRHFYENQLRLLPDRSAMRSGIPPLKYVQVDGVWNNQTNEAEAVYIVDSVIAMIRESSTREIGVITFNHPQQEKIRDLMETAFAREQLKWPPALMIKNIENVQGDEKDVIFFSVGYAPDDDGRFRMQFGSLSVKGGDNRLNVAITRARERMIVVASIQPEQLVIRKSSNAGPVLLKRWLEYVRDFSAGAPVALHSADHVFVGGLRAGLTDILKQSGVPILAARRDVLLVQGNADTDLALLTDDDDYLAMNSPKYLHAQIGLQLENLGWSWKLLYSRNFWLDREVFSENLLRIPRRQNA